VSLPNNCQLKLDKVRRVNRISVISGVTVLLRYLLEIVWKSSENLFGGFVDTLSRLVPLDFLHLFWKRTFGSKWH